MKTKHNKIIGLLATTVMGLTLCSCGGGGGGSSSKDGDSASESYVSAPSSLAIGDTFILDENSDIEDVLIISSDNTLRLNGSASCTYTYSSSGTRAVLNVTYGQDTFLTLQLNFTSSTSGSADDGDSIRSFQYISGTSVLDQIFR